METKTTVISVTKEELVDLFSTALYGSMWLYACYPQGFYKETLLDESDCFEDKLAKCLLAGQPIYFSDGYSEEGESYGSLPCKWNEDTKAMRYAVTLKDFYCGIEHCFNGEFEASNEREKEYIKEAVMKFAMHDCSFDQIDAENIMQVVLFNEIIYG